MEIIQIVPFLPPSLSGVGDYAVLLARQMRKEHDVNTVFLVCDPNWKPEDGRRTADDGRRTSDLRPLTSGLWLDDFPVYQLKKQNAVELLRVLSQHGMPATVLLHFVGYGYQKRGCPVWLVRALREWKSGKEKAEKLKPETLKSDLRSQASGLKFPVSSLRSPVSSFRSSARPRLITMFHELYAFGPPWRSSFWTSPLQKWIAKTLAHMTEHCVTNRNQYARTLQKMTGRNEADFTVLPVISTVGEPERLPEWDERKPRMIVFGSAGWRERVYRDHKTDLEQACQQLNLTEIVDIGTPLRIPQLSVRISQRGILSAQEISREMLDARAGFFAYPTAYLGKSTIFAAYAAHGLSPITFPANKDENEDGLKCGEHYLSANELLGCNAGKTEEIGTRAHTWYQEHSTKTQAQHYANAIHIFVGALKVRPVNTL